MQADVAVRRRLERPRDSADDLKAQRSPEVHRGGVGFDDRVELDAVEAAVAVPPHDVLTEAAADAAASGIGSHHEARGADVVAVTGAVRPMLAEPRMTPPSSSTTVSAGGCCIHQPRAVSMVRFIGKAYVSSAFTVASKNGQMAGQSSSLACLIAMNTILALKGADASWRPASHVRRLEAKREVRHGSCPQQHGRDDAPISDPPRPGRAA